MTNIGQPSEGLVTAGEVGIIIYALLFVVVCLVVMVGALLRTLVSERKHISEAQDKMSDAMNAVALQMALINQRMDSDHV